MSKGLYPARRVIWMPLGYEWRSAADGTLHCCAEMRTALVHDCDIHPTPFECSDTVVVYHEPFAEYGLPIRDGGPGYLAISHCPFCGAVLPASRRDAWFDAVEAAGLDPAADDLPAAFLTSEWRTQRAH